MKRLSALLLLLLLPSSISAQTRWHLIGDWEDRKQSFDVETVERVDAEIIRAWVLSEYTPSTVIWDGTRAKSAKYRFEFNCPQRRLRLLSSTYYDAEGNVVKSVDSENPEWQPAIPETVGEGNLNGVCAFMASAAQRYRPENPFQPGGVRSEPARQRLDLNDPSILQTEEYCRKWGCPDSTETPPSSE